MTKTTFTLYDVCGNTIIKTTNLATAVNKLYAVGHREFNTLTKTTVKKKGFFTRVITTVDLPEPGYNEERKNYLARMATWVTKI
jgi:hypothetical protein